MTKAAFMVRDYYIAYIDKIPISNDFYLDEAYYSHQVYNLINYHEDYIGGSNKMKEVHAPWDPGKSAL